MFTKHLYKLDTNDEIKRYTNKFIKDRGHVLLSEISQHTDSMTDHGCR